MQDGPLKRYRDLVEAGEIRRDAAQAYAAELLQVLHDRLQRYRPPVEKGFFASFFGRDRNTESPRGLYLYGDVGRGKSMLMDMFFEAAPVEHKRRVHFHAFMQEVHRLIHERRQSEADSDERDVIKAVARTIAEDAWLLCFDEFHVTDIADAMILGRLFRKLFDKGVVVVATSNRPPRDLYAGGINRQLFVPFIDMLEERLDIVHLDGPTDFRLEFLSGAPVYHVPAGDDARRRLDEAFHRLIGEAGPEPAEIEVAGRKVPVPAQARGIARFGFEDLCARPLGAADYLAIAERFHTVIIDGIPRMGRENRNEAKRFVTLIDVLYDNHVNLICSAEAPPAELYREGDGAFEFQRTASRLIEMQSGEYLSRHGKAA